VTFNGRALRGLSFFAKFTYAIVRTYIGGSMEETEKSLKDKVVDFVKVNRVPIATYAIGVAAGLTYARAKHLHDGHLFYHAIQDAIEETGSYMIETKSGKERFRITRETV
jgi:hypothetical protein